MVKGMLRRVNLRTSMVSPGDSLIQQDGSSPSSSNTLMIQYQKQEDRVWSDETGRLLTGNLACYPETPLHCI